MIEVAPYAGKILVKRILKQGFSNSIRQTSYAEKATQAEDLHEEEEAVRSKGAEAEEGAEREAHTPASHQAPSERAGTCGVVGVIQAEIIRRQGVHSEGARSLR